jgi:hypothetical protein
MTPEQARLLVRQAFIEQGLTGSVIKGIEPDLIAALLRIAGRIKTLPKPGDLMREQVWRQTRPQLYADLDRFANRLGVDLLNTLKGQVQSAEEFARGYVELGVEKATATGQNVTAGSSVTVGAGPTFQAQPFQSFVMGKDITVTSGQTYFKAISQAGVAGKDFQALFGASINQTDGFISVGGKGTGVARFYMTSIDRLVTQGILEGRLTEDIASDLVGESFRGLNLGMTGRQLKTQATTVVRTAIADSLNRAHEAFWSANNDWEWTDPNTGEEHKGTLIKGFIFDATTDSRACPECSMWDQKYATKIDDLPRAPLHPRCRCVRRPVTNTERLLMKEDAEDARDGRGPKTVGSGIELQTEEDLRKSGALRRGESMKDFLGRQKRLRKAAQQQGRDLPERWYATPVKKDGKVYWRKAVDLPPVGRAGVMRVPEWLGQKNGNGFVVSDATRIDFFGGGKAGEARNETFKRLIKEGKGSREALVALLSVDRNVKVGRYRFKPVGKG